MKKAFAVAIILILALSAVSFSAPRGLYTLKWALKQFEKSVKYAYQSSSWRRRRSGWISRVNRANTPRRMANALVELETSMKWSSVKSSWRSRRSSWISEARAARTVSKFAALLIELEKVTYYKAQYRKWRRQRRSWLSRIRALQ